MLVDGAAVLKAATRSVGAFLDWLDSEVYILGFSKFYEGVTGGTFSPFDVMCLLAAIVPVPLLRRGVFVDFFSPTGGASFDESTIQTGDPGFFAGLGTKGAVTAVYSIFSAYKPTQASIPYPPSRKTQRPGSA